MTQTAYSMTSMFITRMFISLREANRLFDDDFLSLFAKDIGQRSLAPDADPASSFDDSDDNEPGSDLRNVRPASRDRPIRLSDLVSESSRAPRRPSDIMLPNLGQPSWREVPSTVA